MYAACLSRQSRSAWSVPHHFLPSHLLHRADFLVENSVTNGLMTGQFPRYAVIAWPVFRVKSLRSTKPSGCRLTPCLGCSAVRLWTGFIDNPFAESFYRHFQRIVSAEAEGGTMRSTAESTKPTCSLPTLWRLPAGRSSHGLSAACTAYHVFTGDDVQRGFITLFLRFTSPLAIAGAIRSSTTGPRR